METAKLVTPDEINFDIAKIKAQLGRVERQNATHKSRRYLYISAQLW